MTAHDALLADVRFESLLRPELEELKAYAPHVPPGIEVKLDANEAPPARSPKLREVVMRAIEKVALERYPDPQALRLKEAIHRRGGPPPAEILVGSGSDEVIALLETALARPRGKNPQAVVMTPVPTFVMYRITARGHGRKPVEVPLDASWDLDVHMMKRAVELMLPSLLFIASPNNPTSNLMSADRVADVVAAAKEAVVVVDEAYADYALRSMRDLRKDHRHLGILRTVSKIGLAALRVGWLEADAAFVAEIDKVRQPFNLSATSQAAAAAVLEDAWDDVTAEVAHVIAARETLAAEIGRLPPTDQGGFSVTPSASNFLWVKTPGPAERVFEHLVEDKILVRSFHGAGGRMATQLRITVGTDTENDRLLSSLKRFR